MRSFLEPHELKTIFFLLYSTYSDPINAYFIFSYFVVSIPTKFIMKSNRYIQLRFSTVEFYLTTFILHLYLLSSILKNLGMIELKYSITD